ncbi:TetR/AcrR family transcriptional regulator [Rhizorhabdus dicambivorans]|uniref:TetR/AcrR family transcriptional regulator n=1 Tax=Rhizorhabdus dicambivorans TaxID=1850238 RepID=UPI00083689DE|nr:TetR/AcrR family transcriptional regulator [Rhizorhabdus dicambivorans]
MAENVRKRKKTASRQAELLEIAAKIFAEQGYKETGIESILKQAGLTGPALYRHFSSKQEILDTICVNSMAYGLGQLVAIDDDETLAPEEKLRQLLKVRLDYLFGPSGQSHILSVSQVAHLSDAAREKIVAMQREYRARCGAMLKLLRPTVTDGELNVIFFSMQQLTLYGIWHYKRRSLMPAQEYRELLERMMWNTLMA